MKQKIDRVKVQKDLYKRFKSKAEGEFKTISIVIRDLMREYVGKESNGQL